MGDIVMAEERLYRELHNLAVQHFVHYWTTGNVERAAEWAEKVRRLEHPWGDPPEHVAAI